MLPSGKSKWIILNYNIFYKKGQNALNPPPGQLLKKDNVSIVCRIKLYFYDSIKNIIFMNHFKLQILKKIKKMYQHQFTYIEINYN